MKERELKKFMLGAQEYILIHGKSEELISLFKNLEFNDVKDEKGLCIEIKASGMIFLRFYYDKEGNGPNEVREKLVNFIIAQGLINLANNEAGKRYDESGQKKIDEDEKIKQEMLGAKPSILNYDKPKI